jgi:hypothetical protein
MTESSRYKIRNEEARIIFQDEKMQHVLKGVFSIMDVPAREQYPIEQNPFAEHLDEQVQILYTNLEYYDYDYPKEFREAYGKLRGNINDPGEVREFQRLLTTRFLADVYHVNSFVQEYLVNVYRTCEDMHYLLTQNVNRNIAGPEAKKLFDRLLRFRGRLEDSLQRGPTRFGFLKKRRFVHWDIVVVVKYLLGFLCFSSRRGSVPLAPISTETYGILRQARHLSGVHNSLILRREIRDLDALYWATRESDIASLIFVTVFVVFLASILFTIARIIYAADRTIPGITTLFNVAFWASLPSALAAILASFHFFRKFFILCNLWRVLVGKTWTSASTDVRERLHVVCRVTGTQIVLTLARLLASLAAAVALPWSIAENGYGDKISLNENLPFWIALGSVATAIVSTLFFFVVEYVVRYNLDPKLGEYICESFRPEIERMYKLFENPPNNIETKQVQERECWDYTAREFLHRYRLDTVFAADRFGSILQYIQSGMEPRGQRASF